MDTEEDLIELHDIIDPKDNVMGSKNTDTLLEYQGLEELEAVELRYKEMMDREASIDSMDSDSEDMKSNGMTDRQKLSKQIDVIMKSKKDVQQSPQQKETDIDIQMFVPEVKVSTSEDEDVIKTSALRNSIDIECNTSKDIKQEPLQEDDSETGASTSVNAKQEEVDGRIVVDNYGFSVYIKQEPLDEEDIENEKDALAEDVPIKKEPSEEVEVVVEVEVLISEGVKQDEPVKTRNIKTRKPRGTRTNDKGINDESRRYECQICKRRFLGKGHLNTHIRTHTGEKPFECETCKRRFIGKGDLNKHLRTHTGEKPFVCVVCQQGFSQKSILNRHFRIHTGEKAYECQTCLQKFTVKSHLDRHLIVHTGEKAHECHICQQRFSLKSTLDGHLRVHTGEKPFECEVCQQRFSQSSTLNRHFRIHTGERPYECQICQQRFSLKSTLNGHLKTHSDYKTLSDMTKKVVNRNKLINKETNISTIEYSNKKNYWT